MKTLTIKQPWASLIAHGIKDIENRTWRTNYRGRIYIHSSAKDPGEIYKYLTHGQTEQIQSAWDLIPKLHRSAIIGEVYIIDCVLNHESIWAEHKATVIKGVDREKVEIEVPVWNWVLANSVRYDEPILNVKGKLSFWEYAPELVQSV